MNRVQKLNLLQVFSYERQFGAYKLGQVVNIVDESLLESNKKGGVSTTTAGSGGPGVKVRQ